MESLRPAEGRRLYQAKMTKASNKKEHRLRFSVLGHRETGSFGPRWKLRAVKTRLAIPSGGGQAYVLRWVGVHNGHSG